MNESFTVNGTAPILLNESGLYSLILFSRLPKAKAFKRWVTSEVLPSLRKTGSYTNKPMSQLDILAGSIQALQEQKENSSSLSARAGGTVIENHLGNIVENYFDNKET